MNIDLTDDITVDMDSMHCYVMDMYLELAIHVFFLHQKQSSIKSNSPRIE